MRCKQVYLAASEKLLKMLAAKCPLLLLHHPFPHLSGGWDSGLILNHEDEAHIWPWQSEDWNEPEMLGVSWNRATRVTWIFM